MDRTNSWQSGVNPSRQNLETDDQTVRHIHKRLKRGFKPAVAKSIFQFS